VVDNPHLDDQGNYHGDRLLMEEPCPLCGFEPIWEQYNVRSGVIEAGCENCGWIDFS
jgi:predicted RNA-binding Zn-ribbon protein involved in translation (DUF1610 family)